MTTSNVFLELSNPINGEDHILKIHNVQSIEFYEHSGES